MRCGESPVPARHRLDGRSMEGPEIAQGWSSRTLDCSARSDERRTRTVNQLAPILCPVVALCKPVTISRLYASEAFGLKPTREYREQDTRVGEGVGYKIPGWPT
jgi:hypothetical protein